jgi:hypothetical protein
MILPNSFRIELLSELYGLLRNPALGFIGFFESGDDRRD